MAVWLIIILGIVQGASEFLPISSSGHLVVLYNIFSVTENNILLSVVLHIATLLAVLICYRKELLLLIKNPFCKTNKMLIVATIPTVILVVLFKEIVEKSFSGNFIIVGFLITAIILAVSQIVRNKQNANNNLAKTTEFMTISDSITNLNINYKQALLIGVMQGVAVFPGISRSGSTIATGLICGVNKKDSADFSFLLSIPIIVAGMLFELLEIFTGNVVVTIPATTLSVGFLFSFLSGLLSIKLMLKFVKNKNLIWFSVYLILLSLFLILNMFVFKLF